MNVMAKIVDSEEYRNNYFSKLKELDAQKSMFVNLTKQINDNANKKKKAEGKKKKSGDVMVTGATSKEEIASLKRILMQKISEVAGGDEDQKVKTIKLNDLQRKLESLERILRQIEQLEREQRQAKATHKSKKVKTESLYLKSDDLTVNKSGTASIDVSVSGVTASPQITTGVDLIAGFEAAVSAQVEAQSLDFKA